MKFQVLLDVDGVRHEEEVNAPDAKLAITKAIKLHPTMVKGVIPVEEQLEIEPQDHPGQTTVDDPGMRAIGDAVAAEAGGEKHPYGGPDVSTEDLRSEEEESSVWEDVDDGVSAR